MTPRTRDLLLVAGVAALAVAALVVLRAEDAPPPAAADPYRPAPGTPVAVEYRVKGGLHGFERIEVIARGPDDCIVRYRARGGPETERAHALSKDRWEELLGRLARLGFLDVEEAPRAGYVADMPAVTLAYRAGASANEVTIDGRHYVTRDLGPALRFFEEIVKAETPAPVSTGD